MDHTSRSQRIRLEAALVCRAQNGDRVAFDRLVHDYRPLLLGIAFMRTGNADEANDLVSPVDDFADQRVFARRKMTTPIDAFAERFPGRRAEAIGQLVRLPAMRTPNDRVLHERRSDAVPRSS